MASKMKKGDQVIVLSGKDRGKKGSVTKVLPNDNKVLVSGVNVVKRHLRPGRMSAGGIQEMEKPIHVSNVAHVDPKSGKATRIGFKTLDDGRKVRFAKKSGEIIDV